VSFVETLDLTRLYDAVRARELDRLTKHNLACRWLADGVPVNYHGLSDFRVAMPMCWMIC
jgi:hypothetical protein